MRNDHHGKNNKLVKRAFALCLALAVICSCLLPVFATEGGWIATQELDASTQVATMDTAASTSQSGAVAAQPGISTGGGIATGGISRPVAGGVVTDPVVDSGSTSDSASSGSTSASTSASTSTSESTASSTTGTSEVITDPSTITDVKIPDGATNIVKNANGSYSYTTEYGRITVFPTKEGEKTTWTDDEVTITPNPNLKEDDAAFGVLPIEYHFWLKQLDSDTFRELDWEAEMAEMSETEYLALFGASDKFPIWHMDTISSVDTISNYKFANPTSKDDPAGQGREFAYWYTVDENGVESEFNPYNTYGSETATIVNVYAKWKDASGDVVNEDTTKEETTTSGETKTNPVEVSAKANIPDYDGEVTVTVTGLPSNVTHLSVTSMGDSSMQSFCELYSSKNPNSTMAPLLGYKIAPKDANGNIVQPKGPVTVTISGLPEDIMLSELAPFKVLHQVTDYDIETINASYSNGTLTFATDSFSPFVIASKNGYATDTLDTYKTLEITTAEAKQLTGSGASDWYNDHKWSITSADSDIITLTQSTWYPYTATVVPLKEGTVTVTHTCKNWRKETITDIFVITVKRATQTAAIYFLSTPDGVPGSNDTKYWSPTSDESKLLGKISVNDNANYWDIVDNTKKNITNNVGSYILEWPDSTKSGATWTLNRTDTKPTITVNGQTVTAFEYVLNSIWKDYKAEVEKNLNVSNLTQNDITQITLIAHKISRDNSTTTNQFYHIDCTLDIKSSRVFTAKFMVKYPGDTDYTLVDAKNYLTGASVNNTKVVDDPNAKPEVKSTYTDATSGITYQLTGWYTEKNGGPYNENEKLDLKQSWEREPNASELEDGTIYFYAQYVPVSANLTVSKTVTGLLGDTNKTFTFQLKDANGNPVVIDNADGTAISTTGSAAWTGTDGKFTLKHDDTITFNKLPVGTYYVYELNENSELQHYKTTWTGTDTDQTTPIEGNDERKATVTITTDGKTVAFTNENKLLPDTGVLLDTLPYIVILAVVAGGGVLLMLRKRRKNDD